MKYLLVFLLCCTPVLAACDSKAPPETAQMTRAENAGFYCSTVTLRDIAACSAFAYELNNHRSDTVKAAHQAYVDADALLQERTFRDNKGDTY